MTTLDILLIDDNEIDNYISSIVIKESNVEGRIDAMTSAEEALKFLQKTFEEQRKMPDLIFLDVRMPRMDGFEFLERIKPLEQKVEKKCPVVMLSSSLNPDEKAMALQNPCVIKFISKPLTIEAMIEIVNEIK